MTGCPEWARHLLLNGAGPHPRGRRTELTPSPQRSGDALGFGLSPQRVTAHRAAPRPAAAPALDHSPAGTTTHCLARTAALVDARMRMELPASQFEVLTSDFRRLLTSHF